MGPDRKEEIHENTVVIPNYNGIQYLENCLRSLEHCFPERGGPTFAIIIVDNGSDDGSAEMAERLFPWVRLIRFPENRGFVEAVNEGIRQSATPYVFLLNNDTTVDPGCIRRLERRMDSDPALFSVATKMLSMAQPDVMDGAGDLYSALGWAYAIGKGRPSCRLQRSRARIFLHVQAPPSTVGNTWKKPGCWTKSTLPTWRMWILATAPESWATKIVTNPLPGCTMPAAPPLVPATTLLKLPTPPGITYTSFTKTCRSSSYC